MTTSIAALVLVALPFVAVSAALLVVERLQDRRDSQQDRQIMLTDAIHWELGAVAAPVVSRRRGGWRVSMSVPLDRPAEVAALLRVTERHFADDENGPAPFEMVLTPNRLVASPIAVRNLAPARTATNTSLAA